MRPQSYVTHNPITLPPVHYVHVLFIDRVIFVLQAFKFEIRLKLDPTKNSNANPLLNVVLYFTKQP